MKTATVVTWGCTHNQKDSQLIEQQLIDLGYKLVPNREKEDADVVVLNTCTVKSPTESKILHVMNSLANNSNEIVVTGCLSQAKPDMIKSRYPDFHVLGVNAVRFLPNVLNGIDDKIEIPVFPLAPKHGKNAIKSKEFDDWIQKTDLKSTRWNTNLNIIQLSEGCLNVCSFCDTVNARGRLHSFSRESIIANIRSNFAPEHWLTSQDTACWGFDLKDELPNLLFDIDKIDREMWIRVGMGNPNHAVKIVDKLVDSYKSDKIYKFLHLPVQAGSNDVLKHMRRGYKVDDYEFIVKKFRNSFPEMTLSTDVIVGYPTETEDDFEMTLKTIEKTRPSITNISRYWPRKGTPAAKLDQLPQKVRKERALILSKLIKKIQTEDNAKHIGWEGKVLLNEPGSKGGIQARNINYKPVIIDESEMKLGTWTRARIIEAKETYFVGQLIT